MKVKRLPEDFQVEEQTEFRPAGGPFALYRLTKRSMGTPEVVAAICRRWNVARHQVSVGGLKDRHACTRQHLTIRSGPRRHLRQTSFDLEYLGQAPRPFESSDITANRFEVAMRDLSPRRLPAFEAVLADIARDGLPNYFDDQRFGSLGRAGVFVARPWCLGDYERTLFLALAEANEHDRPGERSQKELLRKHWGRWAEAAEALEASDRRAIVAQLVDAPGDFRGAFKRVGRDQRNLYLSAFQGHLWNRVLCSLLREVCRPEQLVAVALKPGDVLFPRDLDEPQRRLLAGLRIPYPSGRARFEPPLRPHVDAALAESGLDLAKLRIRSPRDSFFAKGDRLAMVSPGGLASEAADDEQYPGRRKLLLRFDLPRGSYATILVKRLALAGLRAGAAAD